MNYFNIKKYIFLSALIFAINDYNLFSMFDDTEANNYKFEINLADVADFSILDNAIKLINNYGTTFRSFFNKAKDFVLNKSTKASQALSISHCLKIGHLQLNDFSNYIVQGIRDRKDQVFDDLIEDVSNGKSKELFDALVTSVVDSVENKIPILNHADKKIKAAIDEVDNKYKKNLLLTAGVVTGVIASYYTFKYFSKYLFNKSKRPVDLPKIIFDTSLSQDNQLRYSENSVLDKLILSEKLEFYLTKISELVKRISKSSKSSKFSNLLIYGLNGTGKTSIAKYLAKKSQLDYVRISGSNLFHLDEKEAILALNEFFNWAKQSTKKFILIFDYDSSFSAKSDDLESFNKELQIINYFLNNVNLLNNKFMVIVCANKKNNILNQILSIINGSIEINLPNEIEREKYIALHIDMLLNNEKHNAQFVQSVKEVFSPEKINYIAQATQGLSYQGLENIVKSIKLKSYASKSGLLTEALLDSIICNKV